MSFLRRLREPITSVFGIVIIVITLIGVYKGTIDWQYNATIAIAVGVLLLLAPDKIVAIIIKTFDKISNKITGKSDGSNP